MTFTDLVRPWAPTITQAIAQARTQEDPFRFAALMLRESGGGQALGYFPKGEIDGWGDGGNAYGLFQIDKRFHAKFLASPEAKTAVGQAVYALGLLCSNRRLIRVVCHVPDLAERAAYAAYNCGVGNVFAALRKGLDPDTYTTGHDYSTWIWKRAAALRQTAPDLFTPVAPAPGSTPPPSAPAT